MQGNSIEQTNYITHNKYVLLEENSKWAETLHRYTEQGMPTKQKFVPNIKQFSFVIIWRVDHDKCAAADIFTLHYFWIVAIVIKL